MNAISRLGLGAGRFGSSRQSGSANRSMSPGEAFATLALSADAGLDLIDLPPSRDDAERAVGEVASPTLDLRIVAKTGSDMREAGELERRARSTLERLGRTRAYALVLNDASSLLGPDGPALWDQMKRLKDEGLFQAIGIAACVCHEPLALARRFRPDLMQLPASLLDQRLIADGTLETVAGLGVAVHLRAISLQSLLFLGGQAPRNVQAMTPGFSHLRRVLAEARVDPLQAAMAFALGRLEASRIIVDVASPQELRAVVAAATAPAPDLAWGALALPAPCVLSPLCAAAA